MWQEVARELVTELIGKEIQRCWAEHTLCLYPLEGGRVELPIVFSDLIFARDQVGDDVPLAN